MLTKKIAYYLFLVLLIVPLFQKTFKLFSEAPLQGDFYTKKDAEFSLTAWFDGSFQSNKEAFIDENFGFRAPLLRLNNQLLFSFFNIAKARDVVVGKSNYLFGGDYIKSYTGKDFIGDSEVKRRVERLSCISDELKKRGKVFLVLIAPSKCYYHSEYLPPKYEQQGDSTNYKSYLNYLSKSTIPHIDFNGWLLEQKNKTEHLLYPKTGIHWSNYAAALAADSVVKLIRKQSISDLAGFFIEGVESTEWAKNPDQDIENGCNLWYPIKKPLFAYPIIKADSINKKKQNAFVVSDSYYWNWSWYGLDTMMFKNPLMGYYYNDVYDISAGRDSIHPIAHYGLEKIINNSNVIILMTTEGKLQSFPWGFMDDAEKLLFGYTNVQLKRVKFVNKVIDKIKNTRQWYNTVVVKAKERKLGVEEMIKQDAEFVVKNNYKQLLVEDYIELIKSDEAWLKSIEQKAKAQKTSLEKMIEMDATWMAQQEK